MRRALGIGGGTTLAQAVEEARPTVGHMTPARWRQEGHDRTGTRVLLDGREIPTDTLAEFDDRAGWVELLEGKWNRRTRYTGRVQVIPGELPPPSVEQPPPQQLLMSSGFMATSSVMYLPQTYQYRDSTYFESPYSPGSGGRLACAVCDRTFRSGIGPGQFRQVSMAGVNQWICQPCCDTVAENQSRTNAGSNGW